MTPIRDRLRLVICLLIVALSLSAFPVYAERELLLFADMAMDFRRLPQELEPFKDERELDPHLSIFGTQDGRRFRFLFEATASDREAEIERLQVGVRLSASSTLWLGKFHNPFDYWTSRMQHGRYLQTSRSRPGIFEFEEEGGIMPIHIAGALLEGLHITPDDRGWRYGLALGTGPTVSVLNSNSSLEPPSLFSPFEAGNRHKQVVTARLTYLPDILGDDEFGGFFGRARIPAENLAFIDGDVEQWSAGLFGHWTHERLRVFGAATFFLHRMNLLAGGGAAPQPNRHKLRNYYLQAEHTWRTDWVFYARQEHTWGVGDDAYVQSFPVLVIQRALLGLRYELGGNQALTVEVDRTDYQHGDKPFNTLSLQWSAMFP